MTSSREATSVVSESNQQTAEDINTISSFLSNTQLTSLCSPIESLTPNFGTPTSISPSIIVIAGSAILHQPSTVFKFLQDECPRQSTATSSSSLPPISSIDTLVLTGGIGHSTPHLCRAILQHPVYHPLPDLLGRSCNDLSGVAEATLFYNIFVLFHDGENIMKLWNQGRRLRVIVEDESTNCGANAIMSRVALEQNDADIGSRDHRCDVVIVQDPTMSLRTKAAFEKAYSGEIDRHQIRFWTWPVFEPNVCVDQTGKIAWTEEAMSGVDTRGLWPMERFYGLLLGEVPRLRDDQNGYGPVGKQYIIHVDIASEVEQAYQRLCKILHDGR